MSNLVLVRLVYVRLGTLSCCADLRPTTSRIDGVIDCNGRTIARNRRRSALCVSVSLAVQIFPWTQFQIGSPCRPVSRSTYFKLQVQFNLNTTVIATQQTKRFRLICAR
ncbi:hypothetical protein BD309DRAFT_963839 [Dichomitus squalens]|nr:hypothetical protein BD309DRAFT_963839 [Dichomitus squalens]